MNIAILGAGNSGCALASDYAARGHEVTLIKTSHSLHDDNFSHLCATGGRMRIHEFGTDTDCVIAHLSRDVADVRGKDIVLLCTQTGYHHDVLRRVVPFLTAGQILLMIPGYLSTAYALGLHPADGVIFAEAESNFIDGRICATCATPSASTRTVHSRRPKRCSTGWARRLSISRAWPRPRCTIRT